MYPVLAAEPSNEVIIAGILIVTVLVSSLMAYSAYKERKRTRATRFQARLVKVDTRRIQLRSWRIAGEGWFVLSDTFNGHAFLQALASMEGKMVEVSIDEKDRIVMIEEVPPSAPDLSPNEPYDGTDDALNGRC